MSPADSIIERFSHLIDITQERAIEINRGLSKIGGAPAMEAKEVALSKEPECPWEELPFLEKLSILLDKFENHRDHLERMREHVDYII